MPLRGTSPSAPDVAQVDGSRTQVGGVDASADAAPGACRGDSFDLDALPEACGAAGKGEAVTRLTPRLVLETPSVVGGKTVKMVVSYANETTADVELLVKPGCALFEPEAHQNGTRADYSTDCGFGRGCGGSSARIVLVPGGKVIKRLAYATRIRRSSHKTGCRETDGGPLPPGTYSIKLDTGPFFPLHEVTKNVSADLTITRR